MAVNHMELKRVQVLSVCHEFNYTIPLAAFQPRILLVAVRPIEFEHRFHRQNSRSMTSIIR